MRKVNPSRRDELAAIIREALLLAHSRYFGDGVGQARMVRALDALDELLAGDDAAA